jgi:regulatory protein
MKITRIERQKKNPRRYTIYIDNEFGLGLDKNVVIDYGLRTGDILTESILDELRESDTKVKAYQIATRFLSYRSRSIYELRTRLERDNIDSSIIDRTIQKLLDQQLLDDNRFAELFTESRILHRPVGISRLRRELRQKGIDEEIIARIEEQYFNDEDELKRAMQAADKKLRSDRSTDPLVRKRRLAAHLGRRGFNWDTINRLLEQLRDRF